MNKVANVLIALLASAVILMSLAILSAMIVLAVRWVVSDPQVGLPIVVGVWMGLAWYLHHVATEDD